jgi:hypothetical protein
MRTLSRSKLLTFIFPEGNCLVKACTSPHERLVSTHALYMCTKQTKQRIKPHEGETGDSIMQNSRTPTTFTSISIILFHPQRYCQLNKGYNFYMQLINSTCRISAEAPRKYIRRVKLAVRAPIKSRWHFISFRVSHVFLSQTSAIMSLYELKYQSNINSFKPEIHASDIWTRLFPSH